jgi:exopolyphosphatase/guanosine-5'-triphosphate,3'-diphosphate pyrophosphatase
MNVASIDIGSNTVILLIAEIDLDKKEIVPIVNEYRTPRIGKGLKLNGKIAKPQIDQLKKILEEYLLTIEKHNCDHIFTAATNAFRIAQNSGEILQEIYNSLNLKIEIVSKEKEAELSYFGATYPDKLSENTVIDIGGGSTEIIYGKKSKLEFRKSYPIGVVSLSEKFFNNELPTSDEISNLVKFISETFLDELEQIPPGIPIVAVAGTPTSLVAIIKQLTTFDEKIVDGTVLTKKDLRNFITLFTSYPSNELLKFYPNILSGREDVILSGTILLFQLSNLLRVNEVTVSTKGIRYGLIIEKLLQHL